MVISIVHNPLIRRAERRMQPGTRRRPAGERGRWPCSAAATLSRVFGRIISTTRLTSPIDSFVSPTGHFSQDLLM
ncbi:hypothetical protein BS78_01G499500 [Paspalum vaginatum]|nr:hypothetical protein BS78_01G499500 [Paspalum vaginatum]